MSESNDDRGWVARGLERLSYRLLVPLALLLGLAPWPMGPQPHLAEKYAMFVEGTLTRPIDIFDVFWHGFPIALLLARVVYDLVRGRSQSVDAD